ASSVRHPLACGPRPTPRRCRAARDGRAPGTRRARRDREAQSQPLRVGDVVAHADHHVERGDELGLARVPTCSYRVAIEAFADQRGEMIRGVEEATLASDVFEPAVEWQLVPVLAINLGPGLVRRSLRLDDESVEVEDERADHRRSTSSTASASAPRPSGCGLSTRTRASLTAGKR